MDFYDRNWTPALWELEKTRCAKIGHCYCVRESNAAHCCWCEDTPYPERILENRMKKLRKVLDTCYKYHPSETVCLVETWMYEEATDDGPK
jgi:hypothetical protein